MSSVLFLTENLHVGGPDSQKRKRKCVGRFLREREREREREKEREIGGEKRVVTNVKRQSRLVQIWPFFCAMPN